MEVKEKMKKKFLTNLNEIDNEIKLFLLPEEEILNYEHPRSREYVISSFLKYFPFILIWMCFDITILIILYLALSRGNISWKISYFIIPFFILHLALFCIWLSNLISNSKKLKKVYYILTNKRIIVISKLFKIDFKALAFSEIKDIYLKSSTFDKLLHIGNIYLVSDFNCINIYKINHPNDFLSKIQKLIINTNFISKE